MFRDMVSGDIDRETYVFYRETWLVLIVFSYSDGVHLGHEQLPMFSPLDEDARRATGGGRVAKIT